jgi:hypothetical protein
MRSVTEYIDKAVEFSQLAADTTDLTLKKRYADLAACYRLLAQDRERLIAEGSLAGDQAADSKSGS